MGGKENTMIAKKGSYGKGQQRDDMRQKVIAPIDPRSGRRSLAIGS